MIKIKGDLQATKEEIRIATNSLDRDRLMSSLNSKLWSLQSDIQTLHEICRNQGRTLEVEELSIHEMESNISLCKQQLQAEFVCCNQARQIQLHQLKEKLLTLQQELEIRTEELQSSYCSLLQYQSILDKQSCDLEMLHQHCQMKEDEVTIYEEVMEKNKEDNVRLQEKLQISQEQLALAENRITSLESSLNLYKDKYQAAVNSLELLECQMKALEGDVKIISTQGEDGKKDQPKERTTECLLYELKETQKRLHDALKNGTEQEEVLQELRHKLICSNLKILAHLEEQCEYQCLRVEEHQYLLRDMKKELERVSEQKKKIMKDLMKLELDMHNLLQETATQTERKDGEMKDLKEHIKNLEGQLKESQTLCLEKEKVIQEKDEDLCQKKREMIEMQNTLEAKDSDLQTQKAKVEEVEDALQVLKDKEEKCETQNAALDAQIQQLQCNLHETHQGQLIMGE
ncbi:polyamine-modulated factor 1-binding protein 1-like isoform X2 [Antechinus flavipes]|uniref:polyamine-modulated factor 1-binding protein 1-like isoform X2 n=1 Tax=Antechinus flavipes TaxID=38775 RepID=UPI0022359DD6|nr:polyamine-modulated factor 1-binding protein 1-like isoform X2 [Antechinus flavipes]